MKFKKAGLLLIGTVLALGLNFGPLEAATVTLGGAMDTTYYHVLDGDDPVPGKSSIWEYPLHDRSFHLTHVHPKIGIEISDQVSGELMVCFSDDHDPTVWIASMEYTPFVTEDFGDNPLSIVGGRFMVPFGGYNLSSVYPVDLKTISRPLMYVDHSQEDMELHGGPRPIFMTPYFDTGVMLYGSKWVRGQQDQLWYGVYLVNGMYFNADKYEGLSRIDIDWEIEHVPHTDPSENKQIGGRVAYSYGDLLTVGGSYFTGKYDAESELKNTVYGADVHLALGKANVRFEYARNPVDRIKASGAEIVPEDFYVLGIEDEYTKEGWYLQVDFPFDMVLGESELAEKLEFATMYSYLEKENAGNIEDMSRVSVGVNYYPDPALKFSLEYQFTMLGDMKSTGDIAKYGADFDDLSRVLLSAGLSF